MMGHAEIWRAIDRLARERGLSPSGLARLAGLDPTIFNPSKRMTRSGRAHWPGMESLARVLDATGVSLDQFAGLFHGGSPAMAPPVVTGGPMKMAAFSSLGEQRLFDDDGLPAGRNWEEWGALPSPGPHAYAIRMDTDALEPVFRLGCTLVIAPGATVRVNDRVLLQGNDAGIRAGIVRRYDATVLALAGPGGTVSEHSAHRLRWIHRVALASQ